MVVTGVIWLLLLLLSIVLTILIASHKNEITKTVLLSFNERQKGEFTLDDVRFTPFRQFPDISINLKNLTYFEKKSLNRKPEELPIARIDNFYLGLDLIDLIRGNLNISKLLVDGGELIIVTYPDSSVNLLNALGIINGKSYLQKTEPDIHDSTKINQDKSANEPQFEENVSKAELNAKQLRINNLKLKFQNLLQDRESSFHINNLGTSFDYRGKSASLNLIGSIFIEEIRLNENLNFHNQNLNLIIEAHLDGDHKLEIAESKLEIENSVFKFNGSFNSKNDGELSLNIDGSEASLGLFSQLLRDEGKKNLKEGEFYFKGSVNGKTFIKFPQFEVSFGLKNVKLINPVNQKTIKNINLKGHFNSGEKDDLSKAKLNIDTLNADFINGALKLSGIINNFSAPEVDVRLFLKGDVTGLDSVFNLDFMNNLRGRIEINDRFKGKYDEKFMRFTSEINLATITFEDFGFNITDVLKLDKVNGNISRENNDYFFNNLSVLSDDTDLLINGKVENLQYLFFNIEKEITANLSIKSAVFDLPNFLAFDQSIKRDFPYRILNVDVDVKANTTTSKLLEFKSFPQMHFDIKEIDATAENFLPPLRIKSGGFEISESILGFNLKFDNFKTKFLDGDFNFTGEYNTSKHQPFYIKATTSFTQISPSILFFEERDTIPEFLSGKLSGSFFTEFQFPIDSTFLKFINLKDGNLIYNSPKDTIELKLLSLNFTDIYFNERVNQNPFATLSATGKLNANEIITKYFILNDTNLKFTFTNGEYEIESNHARLFGERAKGKSHFKIKPFNESPTYQIKFDVSEFYAEEMFSVFLEDTIVTGPLSLFMEIRSQGTDWHKVLKDMSGDIKLSGKNLTFYGLDADKLIEKFKRSQSFNLVDLGAVMLAGPVGIAVTKGSDYASIFIIDSGESSEIKKLISNWEINNGNFIIQDAAFTTTKNRVATNGFVNFIQDSLELNVALLNKYGCSIFSQRVYGDLNSPSLERVKVVGTILAPVTNLIDDILGIDCDVFYNGLVKHPTNK